MADNMAQRRERAYSTVSDHYTPDSETVNSPRKSRQGGRNGSRLNIKGSAAPGPSINIIVTTNGGSYPPSIKNKNKKKKKRKRHNPKTEKTRLPVDEGAVERKLDIRDKARDCNERVDDILNSFDSIIMQDEYRLQGRYAKLGTTYEVLKEIKGETEVFLTNLDKIGWDRDEVMEDLGKWMSTRSGEAASMDSELRSALLDGGELVRDTIKQSKTEMLARIELFQGTSDQLSGIFDRAVETAAREIKEGVKKGARIAVKHEKEKMLASKYAIRQALLEESETKKKDRKTGGETKGEGDGSGEGDGNGDENRERSDSAVDKANEILKAHPDPGIVSFIDKYKVVRDRMVLAEGQIRTFELASFKAQDKYTRACEEWAEKKIRLNAKIKEGRDTLRLAEKKLNRSTMKAREKEVRDRKAAETTSFVEKQSNRKGTEMLKMQIQTLKNRVRELEQKLEGSENAMEELQMEYEILEEKLEETKNMVSRAEYDDIKRQLFEASDLVIEARKETAAATMATAEAKAETEKAYEEKALVMDQLKNAKETIAVQKNEIEKLNIKLEEAEIEKQRALAAQKAEYELLLEEERKKTEEQRLRAEEAEAAAALLQDRIEELEQEIEDLKEAHEAAMEALREEHEEEKRKMEEQFAAEKKILEDKIAAAEEILNLVKSASKDMLTSALEQIKTETVQLSKTAVNLYGRAEVLRKVAEDGLVPPEDENEDLIKEISALVVGSAVDLSGFSPRDVKELADATATYRLSTAYSNVLEVIVETEAYKDGLLDELEFVDGSLDDALVSRYTATKERATTTYHNRHTNIAKHAEEVSSSQLPDSFEDEIDVDSLLESRMAATEKRLNQRKAREAAAKRQGETLVAVKQFQIDETRRCEEARNSLTKLDVEMGKVQHFLETGGLTEGGASVTEVLISLRARRMNSTAVADNALLGTGVFITNPQISLKLIQQSSAAYNTIVRTMLELKIAIIETGTEPDGSEPAIISDIRQQVTTAVNELQKLRKDLANAAQIENPFMENLIDVSADIGHEEMTLLKQDLDISEMNGITQQCKTNASDRREEMYQMLTEAINEESVAREELREERIAAKEGEVKAKIEALEAAVETASFIYKKLHDKVIVLRKELTRSEALKSSLSDFIGSKSQLGDPNKLIQNVRLIRSKWINQMIGPGIELSNIPATELEQMSTLYGTILDWISSSGNPEFGQTITQEDAESILQNIDELKTMKLQLLTKHIVQDPAAVAIKDVEGGDGDGDVVGVDGGDGDDAGVAVAVADVEDNSLASHAKQHIEIFSELLNAKVAVVMESNNEDCVAKVKSLTKKSNVLKKNITKKWGTTQQAYYDTFKDEVVEKLLNELAMVENQMKNLDKQIKRLDRDLKKMTIQKEQAEAAVIEIELLLEEERAKSLPPSRESSRQSSRKSKSRASTRQSSRGGMGNLAMGVEEQEMKAREISKQAKMVLLLSGITERLRSIAPPMHRQDILTIADPVAELSQGVLQKIAFIKIQSEGKSEEDQEDILMDAMESIDESASKHMMKELERCLQSLATKVTLGVWIGKPHKTKIEKPKTMKASLRVSRSNVRATGSQKKSNTRKQRQQRQQRQPQHKPPNSKKHSNPASKSELATQKLYVTELEMELNAMSRQVRGHGKLEEMERSMKQSTKLKRMLISKQLHYLGSKLKAEQAKKEILEQTMAESNDEVPEKEMRAAKFANLNAYANLKKELKDLKKLAKQQKISEVKMLNAYEEIAKVSNKVMHQNVDVFSAKGLQESKTRRDLLRLDMLQMTSPGKLTLSPIKKQGAYMHGLVGAKKPRDQPRTHRDEFLTTYHNKKALGVRKEEDE